MKLQDVAPLRCKMIVHQILRLGYKTDCSSFTETDSRVYGLIFLAGGNSNASAATNNGLFSCREQLRCTRCRELRTCRCSIASPAVRNHGLSSNLCNAIGVALSLVANDLPRMRQTVQCFNANVAACLLKNRSSVSSRGVRTQVFSSPGPVLIQEVGVLILIRILFATQL